MQQRDARPFSSIVEAGFGLLFASFWPDALAPANASLADLQQFCGDEYHKRNISLPPVSSLL
jgi:hypothetical protein